MRLLVVEDNKKINALITHYATQDNHEVTSVFTANDALDFLNTHTVDCIITDLMLPSMQGEALIDAIRIKSDVYIIVVSAKTALNDRLNVLQKGADDYLVKPFSLEELSLKLSNVAKRIAKKTVESLSFNNGHLVIDLTHEQVFLDNTLCDFKHQEFMILKTLALHPKQTLSREQVLTRAFKESDAFDRMIDVYIKTIRKKINDNPKDPTYIRTIYGVGYQFIGENDDKH